MSGKTIALFGGTFNPVHLGHLHLATDALEQLDCGRVILVPAMVPVHKTPELTVSAEHRLAMLHIAVEGRRDMCIEACEIERGGLSYSIDTVDYIYRRYDFDGKPFLIVGDDLVDGFGAWRRVDELVKKVNLVIAKRTSAAEMDFPYAHQYLHNEIVSVASSEIRKMIRNDQDISGLVPPGVVEYIEANSLYRAAAD